MDIGNAVPGFILDFSKSVVEVYREKRNPNQRNMTKEIQKIIRFIFEVVMTTTFYCFLKPKSFLESRISLTRGAKSVLCLGVSRSSFFLAAGLDLIFNTYFTSQKGVAKILNLALKVVGVSFILNAEEDGERSFMFDLAHSYTRNVSIYLNKKIFPNSPPLALDSL
ncbi:hypothetical protein EB008_04795 [bacterium]|nr:hypothetical protein [bacterium]